MTIKQFLDLVEIKVVVPSIAPVILGILYTAWEYERLNALNSILLALAAVLAQLAVNTFNRYEDNKRQAKNDYLRDQAAGQEVTDKQVLYVAIILGGIASLSGIMVALQTSWITWVLGIVSFAIGYLYSAGPVPITNTPFGELFSGVTMGYVIFLAMVYVNIPITLTAGMLFQLFVVSLPLTLAIANIMLANNIADFDEDRDNHRQTLVQYLGQNTGKKIFIAWYALAFALIGLNVGVGWLPQTAWLTFILLPLVIKNTMIFVNQPIKSKNFVVVIKNLVLLTFGLSISLILSIVL